MKNSVSLDLIKTNIETWLTKLVKLVSYFVSRLTYRKVFDFLPTLPSMTLFQKICNLSGAYGPA